LALSVHTTLGIPEAATPTDPRHALLVKAQYVTSFDSQRKNPRWTSWELSTAWIGSSPRSPAFVPDPALPANIPQASESDYSHSGFERGHICPSKDRSDSDVDNAATFVFTNAVPQTAASNTGTWETLERDERSLAEGGSHLFIIAGSIYADNRTIGAGVAVPTSMFKVVVVMQGAHPLPTDVTSTTRVISVEIPNTTTVTGDYRGYRTSFGALETKTGFRFLSDVPPAVHDALAATVDSQ
jgi:endonuclease G